MPANKLDVDFPIDGPMAKLQQLIALMTQLEEKARSFVSLMASGGAPAGTGAQLAGTLSSISDTKQAIRQTASATPAGVAFGAALSTPGGGMMAGSMLMMPGSNNLAGAASLLMSGGGSGASNSVMNSASANFRVGAASGRIRGGFNLSADQAELLELSYGSTRLLGQGFDYAANREMQGGGPQATMERADMMSSGLSMGIGALVGVATGNPYNGIAAYGISNNLIGPAMRFLLAPEAQRQAAVQSLSPITGAYGGFGTGRATRTAMWLNAYRQGVPGFQSNLIDAGMPAELQGTTGDFGIAYSTVAGGMLAGGIDPFADTGVSSPVAVRNNRALVASARAGIRADDGSFGGFFKSLAIGAGMLGRQLVPEQETNTMAVTRRLGQLFGTKALPEVSKSVASIYSSIPETGGNVADILMQYGAQDTATYLRTTNDELGLPDGMSPMGLSRSGAAIRAGQRAARMKSLQARGSAAATMGALGGELTDIAALPGGADSMAYATANAQYREAGAAAFEQSTIDRFEIPLTKLQGIRNRLDVMPYSPGNIMRADIGLARGQMSLAQSLSAQIQRRRAAGELSEQEELGLTNRLEGAQTSATAIIGSLGNDMPDRFPTMSVGAPGFAGRYSSWNMAAMRLGIAGSFYRGFGAANGGQARYQNSLFSDLGIGPDAIGPHSRTASFNNGSSDAKDSTLQAINQGIRELVSIMTRGNAGNPSSGGRSSESYGNTWSRQQGFDLGNGQAYSVAN